MILEVVSLIFGGGATGLLGTFVNRAFGYAEKQRDYAHEIKLQDLAMKQRGMELEKEAEIAESAAAATIRSDSYKHDLAAGNTSKWVNNLLRLVRPVLTLFLVGLVAGIWWSLGEENELADQIVAGVLYLTTTAITWWFGDRCPTRKSP